MSNFRRRKPNNLTRAILRIPRQILRKLSVLLDSLKDWTVRRLWTLERRSPRPTAGFVLPTAVMVILVVTLLVTGIVFRSTERAKNASNYRVNQVTLNASLPAIERAKRKIDQLFSDPNLPQGAVSDTAFYSVLKAADYNLADEKRLKIEYALPGGKEKDTGEFDDKVSTTAWRYPVDTDNNGKFDSFTLYGIYFRTPPKGATGYQRERIPLEARTPPQDNVGLTGFCAAAAGTSASLVGSDGWFRSGGNLKKSFYVYTATVPITNVQELGLPTTTHENYPGNKGFTGLEYQQDRVKVPFGNNAVVYEDDLNLFSGTDLKLNGRIITSSNLVTSSNNDPKKLRLYQVSSPESCFYEEENGKILVGGNTGFGVIGAPSSVYKATSVDLFNGKGNVPKTKNAIAQQNEASVNNTADDLAYNNKAYQDRIRLLVAAALSKPATADPKAVQEEGDRFKALEKWFRDRTRRVPYTEVAFGNDGASGKTIANVLEGSGDSLRPIKDWVYPTEVSDGGKVSKVATKTGLNLSPALLKATDPAERTKEEELGDRILTGNGLPALFYNENTKKFEANVGEFTNELGRQSFETQKWENSSNTRYRKSQITPGVNVGQTDRDMVPPSKIDDNWESIAARKPDNALDDKGGLRIITGAGVYLTASPTNNVPTPGMSKVVWPDWMPAIPGAAQPGTATIATPPWLADKNGDGTVTLKDDLVDTKNQPRPFLRMRASAVYHYKYKDGKEPIACVSSYYDPTDIKRAQNRTGLPAFTGTPAPIRSGEMAQKPEGFTPAPTGGESNNGVTYAVGTISSGVPKDNPQILQQAELVYPNGRLVNPLLRQAISKDAAARSLAENAAIDSTLCALQILNLRGTITPNITTKVGPLPHGAIQEVAFLDSREVKQLEWDDPRPSTTRADTSYSKQLDGEGQNEAQKRQRSEYDLPIEQRQPMEVRATVLNLDVLRRQSVGKVFTTVDEYMLPNSGIVYVSRDDALPDASDKKTLPWKNPDTTPPTGANISLALAQHELNTDRVSATDFWLDPTRRVSAVMLVNGQRLARNAVNKFRAEEKGLILATNLPVYIKAQPAAEANPKSTNSGFNVHDAEEFTKILNTAKGKEWDNFYDRKADNGNTNKLNASFACRKDDTRLPNCTGDEWRAVAVLADAITLLSDSFRFGFRNEGDFDLRNNQVDNGFRDIDVALSTGTQKVATLVDTSNSIANKRLDNGFFDNSFATNGLSSDNLGVFGVSENDAEYAKNGAAPRYSSYFNNFVTPVQRRGTFPEYLMETCPKLPVSECTSATDWSVDGVGTKASDKIDKEVVNPKNIGTIYKAGTTTSAPTAGLQKFARRVAFLRAPSGNLIPDSGGSPIPLGIDSGGKVQCVTATSPSGYTCILPNNVRRSPNTLLYRTVSGTDPYKISSAENYNSTERLFFADDLVLGSGKRAGSSSGRQAAQPLLVPLLQIHITSETLKDKDKINDLIKAGTHYKNHWLPWASTTNDKPTTFNLILATGDSPGRTSEFNGALANLPRFMENWARDNDVNGQYPVKIEGSFIQLKRSTYATAPYWQLLPTVGANGTLTPRTYTALPAVNRVFLSYPQFYKANNTQNQTYEPPRRLWGFDVGLLSQIPDAFAKKLNSNSSEAPSEYYRETSRDDAWVKTLLCAKTTENGKEAVNKDQRSCS